MIDLRKRQEAYQANGLVTINYIVPLTFEGDECTYYEIFRSRRTAERSLSRRGMYDEVLTFRQVAKAYPKYFKY